jgi:tRNA(fMet)-specific endonuclease VapC
LKLQQPIVNFEEQMRGWLSYTAKARTIEQELIAYNRLKQFLDNCLRITVLKYDEESARVFQQLKSQKLRVGTKWI